MKTTEEWRAEVREDIRVVRAGHGDGRQVTNEGALAVLDDLDEALARIAELERERDEAHTWGQDRRTDHDAHRCCDVLQSHVALLETRLEAAHKVLLMAAAWSDRDKVFFHHVSGPGCTGDVLHEIGVAAAALTTLTTIKRDGNSEQT